MSDYSAETIAWAETWDKCWRCGYRAAWPYGMAIHHFVRGANRKSNNLATTIMLCNVCHWREHDGDALGLLGCLRLKREHDPKHFDLEAVNRARGRAPGAITAADIEGRPA